MTTAATESTGDVVMGGEDQRVAAIVESSPNPFSKAAEAANRLRNKKKALQQAKLFMDEAKAGQAMERQSDGRGT